MHCPSQNPETANVLLDYSARKLTPQATTELERHLESCPECKTLSLQQHALWTALDSWKAAPVNEDFDRKLYSRIEEFESRSWVRRWFADGFAWRPALSFGTACAVLAIAFVWNTPPYNHSVTNLKVQEGARVEVEPEQVERALEDLDMLKQLSSNTQNL